MKTNEQVFWNDGCLGHWRMKMRFFSATINPRKLDVWHRLACSTRYELGCIGNRVITRVLSAN